MTTNYSLSANGSPNRIQSVLFVQSKFKMQEAITQALVKEINRITTVSLIIAYNDAKDELNKQAVIEAAQELGFYDLSIQMINELT
jgi:hypothetical protein